MPKIKTSFIRCNISTFNVAKFLFEQMYLSSIDLVKVCSNPNDCLRMCFFFPFLILLFSHFCYVCFPNETAKRCLLKKKRRKVILKIYISLF